MNRREFVKAAGLALVGSVGFGAATAPCEHLGRKILFGDIDSPRQKMQWSQKGDGVTYSLSFKARIINDDLVQVMTFQNMTPEESAQISAAVDKANAGLYPEAIA